MARQRAPASLARRWQAEAERAGVDAQAVLGECAADFAAVARSLLLAKAAIQRGLRAVEDAQTLALRMAPRAEEGRERANRATGFISGLRPAPEREPESETPSLLRADSA